MQRLIVLLLFCGLCVCGCIIEPNPSPVGAADRNMTNETPPDLADAMAGPADDAGSDADATDVAAEPKVDGAQDTGQSDDTESEDDAAE